MNCWGIDQYFSLCTLLVLALTAAILVWYSFETQKLRITTEKAREESERAREIEFHPWLDGSNLNLDPQPGHDVLIFLPVRNAGRTPAINLSFESDFFVEGIRTSGESYKNLFISPNGTAHFRIARFKMDDHSRTAHVSVKISYSTHMKGSGLIKQGFEYTKGGWRNKEAEYAFVLSNGEIYPK